MPYIFLNNQLLKKTNTQIDSFRPGKIDAKGVFETIGVYNGEMLFVWQHFKRFEKALAVYKIQCPYSHNILKRKLLKVLKFNRVKEGRIRLAVWQSGEKVNVAIVSTKVKMPSAESCLAGYILLIASKKRSRSRYSHVKSMKYGFFEKAMLEAKNSGYDEAIILNNKNNVVECSASNIFIVKDNCLMTPPIKDGCLRGIVRQEVVNLARKLNIKVCITSILIKDLIRSQELFLTNSFIGIMPVLRIKGYKRNFRIPGETTQKLFNAYRALFISKNNDSLL